MSTIVAWSVPAVAALAALRWLHVRSRLSRAKHPSLRGHARMARRVARLVCFYEYDDSRIFRCDGAPEEIARARRTGFERLRDGLRAASPRSIELSEALEDGVSDVLFTNSYRVPFQFRNYVKRNLKLGALVEESAGTRVRDVDGNWSYDLGGSYGVNVFGYDFYKECIDAGVERVRSLGPVLGPYHPLIVENVAKLKEISGLDEISFHMSGTEAVMQVVRLARFHTRRSHLVRFCGAYHGWWDGVQPGLGNDRPVDDVYTLKDMDERSLEVLRTRTDIACVLVNPTQAMHPNADAPGDATLINSERRGHFDREAYTDWLKRLRQVCTERDIVLVFDEILVGFRLARGGAQEYFGVRADMVTYGKTLGGGLPVGVVCGKHRFMKRFRDDRPEIDSLYEDAERLWNERAAGLNARRETQGLPVRVANMSSVWTTLYQAPSRYNWMFQYYLRAQGLAVSWIGTGRFIFSLDFLDEDFEAVAERYVAALRSAAWRDRESALRARDPSALPGGRGAAPCRRA